MKKMKQNCNKLKQIETTKKARKPYTGKSRSTEWRVKKKKEIETKKTQEIMVLKQEKANEYVALGMDENQGEALANVVINSENVDVEKLITDSLKAQLKAKKILDDMIIQNKIKIENAGDWAYIRKAIE